MSRSRVAPEAPNHELRQNGPDQRHDQRGVRGVANNTVRSGGDELMTLIVISCSVHKGFGRIPGGSNRR
jgi:hypothetical protein